MKKIILIFSGLLISLGITYAQNFEAYFHYSKFNSPQGPYLETYMSTIGRSVVFSKTDKGYQAEIEVTMIFKQNDSVKNFDKYVLKSPVIKDSLSKKPNFVDVQRIPIDEGVYNFELSIKDINRPANNFEYEDTINIQFPDNKLAFSGFQLVESYHKSKKETQITKNGIDMVPYVSDFYPGNMNSLIFYIELYNSDKIINDEFIIKYYISKNGVSEPLQKMARFKRKKSGEVVPLLGKIDISDLQSGNYDLVVEVVNKKNESLIKTEYFFQRSKPMQIADFEKMEDYEMNKVFGENINNKDSLIVYIKSLRPIATKQDKQFIDNKLEGLNLKYLQRFFYTFWYNMNSDNPGDEWLAYKKQIYITDRLFSTRIKRGFETDRGIVYLKYGAPNDMYKSDHEPSAYPYEIWAYYKAGNERNKKFVFYNSDLAGNDFDLLHSNVTGEVKTPNWERYLSKRNNSLYNQDEKYSDDQWGSRAREYYNKY